MISKLNNTFYRLKQTDDNNIGLVAIIDIQVGINPFKYCFKNIFKDYYVKLDNNDIKDLNNEIKSLLNKLYDGKYYYVPYYGLNSMNMFFYIKIDVVNFNIDLNKTIKNISKNEELIINKIDFSKFKILNDKKPVIENLKNIYCKIGISPVQGVGVIAIKDIPKKSNPFIITNNKCYNYYSKKINKNDLKLLDKEIIKMITDFIHPIDNIFYIPSNGINSLNITFFLNHNINPNLTIISDGCEYLGFITNKDIKKGEELFIDYDLYESNFDEIIN
jgi:hypothetical protein